MNLPVIGFAAWSGTGKTTLLEQVVSVLTARGLRVATIKHAHHDFDIDQSGKDSYRHRQAGARQVIVASKQRFALISEHDDGRPEPRLDELLAHLDPTLDLVLVEGFKHEPIAKIELHRPALGKPLLYPHDADIKAVATDAPLVLPANIALLDINDPDAIATFVVSTIAPASKNTF